MNDSTLKATTVDFGTDVLLSSSTVITGTDVTFKKTLNGVSHPNQTLTVNASGVTTFDGTVGNMIPLLALVTDAQGGLPGERTVLSGGTIHVTTVDFKDNVVLMANTTATPNDTVITGGTVKFARKRSMPIRTRAI